MFLLICSKPGFVSPWKDIYNDKRCCCLAHNSSSSFLTEKHHKFAWSEKARRISLTKPSKERNNFPDKQVDLVYCLIHVASLPPSPTPFLHPPHLTHFFPSNSKPFASAPDKWPCDLLRKDLSSESYHLPCSPLLRQFGEQRNLMKKWITAVWGKNVLQSSTWYYLNF